MVKERKPLWCPRCENNHNSRPDGEYNWQRTLEGKPIVYCAPCAIQLYYESATATARSTQRPLPATGDSNTSLSGGI